MDNYGYDYPKYSQNYQMATDSIQDMEQRYINNNISNSYQFYDIKTYERDKYSQKNYENRIYPKTMIYRKELNLINIENEEDFSVYYSQNIEKTIQKVPKDTIKIPRDSKKNKQYYTEIKAYPNNNYNYNNITTINNNNYNKINSINIIFDANNIYNNNDNKNYIKYNNFNDIGFMENNYNKRMNLLKNENNKLKIEKQPKDNFKNYTDSVSQMNNFINNNKLIRLKKNEGKELFDKNNSYNISNNKNNYPKNSESNKIENKNKNKITDNKFSYANNNIKKINKVNNINDNIIFNNKKNITKNSINKIEKLKNNKNYVTDIKIKDNKINKKLVSPKSHKNINTVLNTNKLNYNYRSKRREREREKEKEKQIEKSKRSKKLRQTKSYVDKYRYNFLQRRNTFQKNELNKNYSFNAMLKNSKSKEKEKSNFAFLISKKKMKMFSSFKQINTFNTSSYKKEKNKYLSKQKNDIIYERERKTKGNEKNNYKTLNLEDQDKISKTSSISNNEKYKRLYTPQLSNTLPIKKKIKKIIDKKDINYSKKKSNELTRNISYNISFNYKKKNLFKKKTDFSDIKALTVKSSRNKTTHKFKSFHKIEDSLHQSNINEKDYSNNIINTEHIEEKKINPLMSQKIDTVNQSEKNVLALSERNIKNVFTQKTANYHLKKKNTNLHTKNTNSKYLVKSKKNTINKPTTKNNKTSKTNLSNKNSDEKKKVKKIIHVNNKTTRISRKNMVYWKQKDRSNSSILDKKKNLFSFNKKTQKKNLLHIYSFFSEDKKDLNNNSFRGFSSSKKLEEIKKKYKFRPQTKEKKNNLKEKNINYIEESKGFSKFINFTNLEEDTKSDKKEKVNLNIIKDNQNNNVNKNSNNNDVNINNNENKNNININDENDLLNDKSFILDLNNVIPINEKKLIDTVTKISISHISIGSSKFEKDINDKPLVNENINKEKKNEKKEENKNNDEKSIAKNENDIKIKEV